MTFTQMQYFLTVAKTLNLTKAASLLYISQPALSKQISAIERELNMQLFIREPKFLRLTPAGSVLAQKLPLLLEKYKEIVEEASTVNAGFSGSLNIGILESQWVSKVFSEKFQIFCTHYPNISVKLNTYSFGGLRDMLASGEMDLALTLKFDIEGQNDLMYSVIGSGEALFIISRAHPLGRKEHITIPDLAQTELIVISPEDSPKGAEMIINEFSNYGFIPQIRYAPNLSTAMLWVEAGIGVGVTNMVSPIIENEYIRILDDIPLGSTDLCIVWHKNNQNTARLLFIDLFQVQ